MSWKRLKQKTYDKELQWSSSFIQIQLTNGKKYNKDYSGKFSSSFLTFSSLTEITFFTTKLMGVTTYQRRWTCSCYSLSHPNLKRQILNQNKGSPSRHALVFKKKPFSLILCLWKNFLKLGFDIQMNTRKIGPPFFKMNPNILKEIKYKICNLE